MNTNICAKCKEEFEIGSDKVVCPVCGAAYHRDCYAEIGGCIFTDVHDDLLAVSTPEETAPENGVRCSSCGLMNEENAIFCSGCGNSIKATKPEINNFNEFVKTVNMAAHYSDDETIDDIKMKDYSDYIGTNQVYFIPKFRALGSKAERKPATFNLVAFFAPEIYFNYRKMWLIGIPFLLFSVFTSIPSFYSVAIELGLDASILINNFEFLISSETLQYFLTGLMFCLKMFCGLFANKLYFDNATRKIRSIKELGDYSSDTIKKAGGVNFIVAFGLPVLASFIIMMLL